MKAVILAGGFGTRLSEYTDSIPKPMVRVGGIPLLDHIMRIYDFFGVKDFVLPLGYKGHVIKDHFLNFHASHSDFTVNLRTGETLPHVNYSPDWNITMIETGLNTMTGGRLKRLKKYLNGERFFLTYGDGLADVDIDALLKFHNKHNRLVTMTVVKPNARFGEVELSGDDVTAFVEKPQLQNGWVNGGYFVIEPEFIDLIESDETMLERAPMELAVRSDQVRAFRHEGFWQCVDTKRDLEYLENLWAAGTATWIR